MIRCEISQGLGALACLRVHALIRVHSRSFARLYEPAYIRVLAHSHLRICAHPCLFAFMHERARNCGCFERNLAIKRAIPDSFIIKCTSCTCTMTGSMLSQCFESAYFKARKGCRAMLPVLPANDMAKSIALGKDMRRDGSQRIREHQRSLLCETETSMYALVLGSELDQPANPRFFGCQSYSGLRATCTAAIPPV